MARWALEVALIVGSVFVAIFLEGLADDASRTREARTSIAQLTSQLRADSADLASVRAHQEGLSVVYDSLLAWLGDPSTLDGASVQDGLDQVAFLNRTMYPRKGSWEAITSTGQLAWVGDHDLVAGLGNFYESMVEKLEYMGQDYDYNVNEVARVIIPRSWDAQRSGLRGEEEDWAELRGQLRYLRLSWNEYYLDLLGEYSRDMDVLLRDLDAFLAEG